MTSEEVLEMADQLQDSSSASTTSLHAQDSSVPSDTTVSPPQLQTKVITLDPVSTDTQLYDHGQEINELHGIIKQMISEEDKNVTVLQKELERLELKQENSTALLIEEVSKLRRSVDEAIAISLHCIKISQKQDNVIKSLRRQNSDLTSTLRHIESESQASLDTSYNGEFLWKIPDVLYRTHDAKQGHITSIYSPPFYTGRNGYKMCIRAYLNGDGTGKATYLSIFFVLMKGEYDPLLQWPFEHKVSLILVDQDHSKSIIQSFKPNVHMPTSHDQSRVTGFPKFAQLSVLDNPSYVKDDTLFIKAIVDTSKINHP